MPRAPGAKRRPPSQAWLQFDEQHFRSTLSAGLGLLGVSPLKADPQVPGQWIIPDLAETLGQDPD